METYFAYDDTNLYVALHSVFPLGAIIPKGGTRLNFDDPDEQVWDDESFELWLQVPGKKPPYRFAGNAAGGYTELFNMNYKWRKPWTHTSSMSMDIFGNEHWQVEMAVPLKSLGIVKADGAKMRMNICRTWRCLDHLGVTSWAGHLNYPITKYYGAIELSPAAPGYNIKTTGSPSAGEVTHAFKFHNSTKAPINASLDVTLVAANPDNNKGVDKIALSIKPGQ